jgi:hypothetical protein
MSDAVPKLARWIPPPARATIEKLWALPDLRPDHLAILSRLATDPNMQTFWEAIARIGGGNESDVILLAFARSCQALEHKAPFPRRKKDREKRLLDEAAALTKPGATIYTLANTAAIASMLVDAMGNTAPAAKAFLANKSPVSFEQLLDSARDIAHVYANLADQQDRLNMAFPLPRIGKSAAKNAPELIFSAAMTNSFLELFGSPLDGAVAILTDVIFDYDARTEGSTIRGRRRRAKGRNISARK